MRQVRGGVRRSGRMSGRRAVVAVVTSLLGVMLSTTPGMAADSGTVDAQVTISESAACIELSVSAISFGTLALGAEDVSGSPAISVSNCADADATILASGTNATGASGTWNLVDSTATCANTLGLDNYHLGLATPEIVTTLSTSNKEVASLAAAASIDHVARIWTACPGSLGAGETMSMQISYVATSSTQGVDADGDGFTVAAGDCNDGDAAIYPGAPEVLNGFDDNCDGVVDEGFVDADGDGFAVPLDCDDSNAGINPNAPEVFNGLDDDCDGVVDEGFVDADADGWPVPLDCDDSNAAVYPGAVEVLDGLDNNCDGVVDEGF